MATIKTDSKTDVGIAVGLINTIINCAKVLAKMDNDKKCLFFRKHKEIQEALMDLYGDKDMLHIWIAGLGYSGKKIIIKPANKQ